MRNVLSPTRCVLSLASIHHAPWGFLKIKRVFPRWKRLVAHPSASRSSCTSLCSLGGGGGAVRVFLIPPVGTAQTRLCACKEHCRERRVSRRADVSGHLWVPLSTAGSGTPRRRDRSLRAALHEAKLIYPSRGSLTFWLSTPELQTRTIHCNCMFPVLNSPLKRPPQKYTKSRAQGHK